MQLSRLLKQIMKKQGISNSNIVDRCDKMGIKITKDYISKILSNSISEPSNEKLEAIAKACNVHPKLFVLENYIDKAPKELANFLYNFRVGTAIAGTKVYSDLLKNTTLEEIKNVIEEMPMSQFILEDSDFDMNCFFRENNTVKLQDNQNNFSVQLIDSAYLVVPDDSMEPIIPKNSKITLYDPQPQYRDGDIVAVKIRNEENFVVRQVYIGKDSVTLTVINNNNYCAKKYKKEEIVILGKVHKIIKEL